MSIAAFEQCSCRGVGVFYVQTPEIVWLNPTGNENSEKIVIAGSLPLRHFLQAHGIDLIKDEKSDIPKYLRDLAGSWANRAEKYANAYSTLNYYAGEAEGKLELTIDIREDNRPKHLTDLLSELENDKS